VIDNAHEPNSPLAIARFGAFALGQQEDMRFGLKSSPKSLTSFGTSHIPGTLYEMANPVKEVIKWKLKG